MIHRFLPCRCFEEPARTNPTSLAWGWLPSLPWGPAKAPARRQNGEGADLIICYIGHQKGGAWQTVDYAMKQGKAVINLSDEHENNSKLFEKSEESN